MAEQNLNQNLMENDNNNNNNNNIGIIDEAVNIYKYYSYNPCQAFQVFLTFFCGYFVTLFLVNNFFTSFHYHKQLCLIVLYAGAIVHRFTVIFMSFIFLRHLLCLPIPPPPVDYSSRYLLLHLFNLFFCVIAAISIAVLCGVAIDEFKIIVPSYVSLLITDKMFVIFAAIYYFCSIC